MLETSPRPFARDSPPGTARRMGAIEDLASHLELPIWKRITAAPVEGGVKN
ncbi:hypothetical protein NKH48_27755 [Mesorhizobium sp. M1233]|uniref:hypothetical protein n=1 Tax=Mesorhizobium sp. M1233 TaxID=2957072 RepID=UPI003335EA96